MVAFEFGLKGFEGSTKDEQKEDLPTPESPISTVVEKIIEMLVLAVFFVLLTSN